MPRIQEMSHWHGNSARGIEKVIDTFTLRQDLPDGSIIRTDGKGLWMHRRMTWMGQAPKEWDPSKAVKEDHKVEYSLEVDYS